MASESGVLPIPEEKIVRKWRLQPGRMLLIDLEEGRIVEDEEVKARLADAEPYAEWLAATQFDLKDLPPGCNPIRRPPDDDVFRRTQISFGYTDEDLKFFLAPMAAAADDPIGSMGTDTPLAVLSDRPRLLYDYFKQNFAQVTNPPIDPIRESLVMTPRLDDRAAAEPARPQCRQPQKARSLAADPHQRGSGEDPLDPRDARRRLPHDARSTPPGRRAATPSRWRRRCSGCAGRRPRRCSPTSIC